MFVTTAQIIGDYYRLARMVNNQGYFAVQVKTPLSSTVLSQVQTVTPLRTPVSPMMVQEYSMSRCHSSVAEVTVRATGISIIPGARGKRYPTGYQLFQVHRNLIQDII